ncbi:MAG: crossover junction endodeoxyribonuclease RuvC [Anaerolineae bacterium]
MRVLGIDPGTATTGYGIVEEHGDRIVALSYGVITTPTCWELARRLQEIYRQLRALLHEWQPESAAVEEIFFNKNTRTALAVGQARGVVLLALADADVPIHEYKPSTVKEAITGYGAASKGQMQLMVQHLLGLSQIPGPDDAADALALAICDLHFSRWRALSVLSSGGL